MQTRRPQQGMMHDAGIPQDYVLELRYGRHHVEVLCGVRHNSCLRRRGGNQALDAVSRQLRRHTIIRDEDNVLESWLHLLHELHL